MLENYSILILFVRKHHNLEDKISRHYYWKLEVYWFCFALSVYRDGHNYAGLILVHVSDEVVYMCWLLVVWLWYLIPCSVCSINFASIEKRNICALHLYMHASSWHVFRSSYLQRFHTHGPHQQNIGVAGYIFDLTDSQVAFWWNSIGSQFAFLNEDLRHKGTDANILLCFSQKSIDSPTFLLHWNPSQDIK
jgi:hypothetical protein